MSNTLQITTAQTPSFGMPVRDAAYSAAACLGMPAGKRVRDLGGLVIADSDVRVAATQGAFPGTTAWRPPSC